MKEHKTGKRIYHSNFIWGRLAEWMCHDNPSTEDWAKNHIRGPLAAADFSFFDKDSRPEGQKYRPPKCFSKEGEFGVSLFDAAIISDKKRKRIKAQIS